MRESVLLAAIVYLHGWHLHDDVRNAPAEIRGDGVMPGEEDVVSQFRESTETPGRSLSNATSQAAPSPRLKTPPPRFRRPLRSGGWTFSPRE